VLMRDEELIILYLLVSRVSLRQRVKHHTRCIERRIVSAAVNAINRKGLGAACTAVLVKFRFPLMSCHGQFAFDGALLFWYLESLSLDLAIRSIQVFCNDNVCYFAAV
jgi:hypothetical protein